MASSDMHRVDRDYCLGSCDKTQTLLQTHYLYTFSVSSDQATREMRQRLSGQRDGERCLSYLGDIMS